MERKSSPFDHAPSTNNHKDPDGKVKEPVEGNGGHMEDALGCGCYQGLLFLSFQYIAFILCMNAIFMAFGKAEPSHWNCGNENGTLEEKCQSIDTETCRNFTSINQFYSIVDEWQLLCGRTKYLYLIITLHMLGSLFGSPFFSQISDLIGRKWGLIFSTFFIIVTGLGSAFVNNWQGYAALRFLNGFACGGAVSIAFVYHIEFLAVKYRNPFLNVGGWSCMFVVLGIVAWALPNWKTFSIVVNAAGVPIFALIWFLGETPRWLIHRGRLDEARSQLRKIAKLNRTFPDEATIEMTLKECQAEKTAKRYTLWHLFYSKKLIIVTVVLDICYFCVASVFLATTFSMDSITLTGNIFTNFIVMSVFRFIACNMVVAADFYIPKFGRKVGFCVPFAVMGGLCLAIMSVQIASPSSTLVADILAIIIAVLSQPLWIVIWLSNGEVYPTPIRNAAVGFNVLFEFVGASVAPQILYLGLSWRPAPYLIFAVLSVLATVLYAIFIPETKGKPLPEAMPERKRKRKMMAPPKETLHLDRLCDSHKDGFR